MLYLIDSAAILNDFNFYFGEKKYLTTPLVISEIIDFRSRALVDNALQQGLLKIAEPEENSLRKIREKGKNIGMRLSDADISLIALAVELKAKRKRLKVLTDDYSVQNLLSMLKIPYSSVLRAGIKKEISFRKYCPACGKKFPLGYVENNCDICGSRLRKEKKID